MGMNPGGFAQQARPVHLHSPSMLGSSSHAVHSPQNFRHTIGPHDQRKVQEEENWQRAQKLLMVECENKIRFSIMAERVERQKEIQSFANGISRQVNEAVNRMSDFSSCCDRRLKVLEGGQSEQLSLCDQLSLVNVKEEESIGRHQESVKEAGGTKTSLQEELDVFILDVYKSLAESSDVRVESHRHLEERLQSLSAQLAQRLEVILQSSTPLEAHRNLEERFQTFGVETNKILDVMVQSYGTKLQDLGRRLGTASVEHSVKYNEFEAMLQSDCAAWREQVKAEGSSRPRELSVIGARLDQHVSSYQQLVGSQEVSLATAEDRDALEGRWDKMEIRLCALEARVDSFISGLKPILVNSGGRF